MEIKEPEIKKTLVELDFVFSSGHIMPITLDASKGDTYDESDEVITIDLTSKPSANDPSMTLPAEQVTIYKKHLISIQKRKKEVLELTAKQKFEWSKTFKEMTKTVQ